MNRPAPAYLSELTVTNLGLIEEAHVEPGRGLVVVTGETGTGKTLLLGALRLLRGEPAGKGQVGPFGPETAVAGRFVAEEIEVVLERRVGSGRSKAYLDGSMAPARALGERSEGMIDIVGQHDRLRLADRAPVRALVDGAMDRAGRQVRERYDAAWRRLEEIRARLEVLGGDRRALERELDMLRFQVGEIADAGFAPGDDEVLETEAVRLRNAEALGEHLAAAARGSGDEGAARGIEESARALRTAAKTDPSLAGLAEQAAETASLLADLNADILRVAADLERDPGSLAEVENRLALLAGLRRKYGDSLDEVLAFGERAAARAFELEDLIGRAENLTGEERDAQAEVATIGDELRRARERSGRGLAAAAEVHLRDLGFVDPVVQFDVAIADPGATGADAITLRFASDAALEPGLVSRIASGGELSRLVLALRLAGSAGEADVVAFDEIDAGVGGATALAMGRKLAALSDSRQVLCVTHLPQVAAFASTHLVVSREGNRGTVRRVSGDERVAELSRMLAGLPESGRGRDHAEELLALAANR